MCTITWLEKHNAIVYKHMASKTQHTCTITWLAKHNTYVYNHMLCLQTHGYSHMAGKTHLPGYAYNHMGTKKTHFCLQDWQNTKLMFTITWLPKHSTCDQNWIINFPGQMERFVTFAILAWNNKLRSKLSILDKLFPSSPAFNWSTSERELYVAPMDWRKYQTSRFVISPTSSSYISQCTRLMWESWTLNFLCPKGLCSASNLTSARKNSHVMIML